MIVTFSYGAVCATPSRESTVAVLSVGILGSCVGQSSGCWDVLHLCTFILTFDGRWRLRIPCQDPLGHLTLFGFVNHMQDGLHKNI